MKIKFSDHSNIQRIERKIPKKDILATIKNPENMQGSYRKRRLLQKRFGDKILEVVTVKEEDFLIVITQYYLEEKQ